MINDIGGVTSALVGAALDAALLRHEIIANNIANVDTPGYRARRLNFEEQLRGFVQQGAMNGSDDLLLTERINWVKDIMNGNDAMIVTQNQTVELDREMVHLTENTLRYQALLQASSKRGELIRMAVKEGRQ